MQALFENHVHYYHCSRRVLWECLHNLHMKLSSVCNTHSCLPASPELILLFLLGYPVLADEVGTNNDEQFVVDIHPWHVPQNVSVKVFITRSIRTAVIRFDFDSNELRFEWQNWINCSMGYCHGNASSGNRIEEIMQDFSAADLSQPLEKIKYEDADDEYEAVEVVV